MKDERDKFIQVLLIQRKHAGLDDAHKIIKAIAITTTEGAMPTFEEVEYILENTLELLKKYPAAKAEILLKELGY